ncbi:uncharacterized protein L969DRAFT_313465 [Mixia osmundae IAM 14324]|uniref:BTB domain-containing protein n=1 Tax=Mixia osmundae (strain CBS 9802 / IAM 14324 / JCM 22182 / KY 12970) TaxID=764103 RepID=G7DYG2_MIXOS|nr:uncharacterized protein L969DRAFT_313465 [Mixia osmundae IAM 14324]KEI41524.1 hypothetical protein L969DRAFT_313465 [Mixia osmundae IAM 14324]GAA95622.1 hypothetical protein E5Q_02278 [Mixia osmundae IAM 14324]
MDSDGSSLGRSLSTSTSQPKANDATFSEIRNVTLEWKLNDLKKLFESSRGETKSRCVKSALFGGGQWQLLFYANAGGTSSAQGTGDLTSNQYCALYLSGEPTAEERERGVREAVLNGGNAPAWRRDGLFKFSFEVKSVSRSTVYKSMEAADHEFSATARNWGWSNFWKRGEAYFNNASVKAVDSFIISCSITFSPAPPSAASPLLGKRFIPQELVDAYASLFDDALYSDVVFVMPTGRKLYASKKILTIRSEYFASMLSGDFAESFPPDRHLFHPSDLTADRQDDYIEDDEESEWMCNDSDDPPVYADTSRHRQATDRDTTPSQEPRERQESQQSDVSFRSTEASSHDEATASAVDAATTPHATGPARSQVFVTDALYANYRALLFYLYTDNITFAPLSSNYYAARLAALESGQAFPYSSRDHYVHKTATRAPVYGIGRTVQQPLCSAKAIYRLADKLGLPELKHRAFDHIIGSLTVETVCAEAFSAFSAQFPELQKVQVDYLSSRWSEVRTSRSMTKALASLRSPHHAGVLPAFEQVFSTLLSKLDFSTRATDASM